jgi:1,4-alpha-glucan branching enzyme
MVAPSALEQTVAAKKIVIEYKGAGEQEVGLVGDFNQWGKKNVPIAAKQVDGRWVFEIELAPGRYEYAFVINGKKWLPDPQAAGIIPDGFGGLNSVLYVHGQGDKTL